MIVPGIFEKSFEEIKNKIDAVEGFTRRVQIDVADGLLVDGRTFDEIKRFEEIKTNAEIELHLMVENPLKYLITKVKNVQRICFQIEEETSIKEAITIAANFKYVIGLSIGPVTPSDKLNPYLDDIDFVQFMTIKPGGQGRDFDYNVLAKIASFRQKYPFFPIQADGGIDAETLPMVLKLGVSDVIIGSELFNQNNIREAYVKFNEEAIGH